MMSLPIFTRRVGRSSLMLGGTGLGLGSAGLGGLYRALPEEAAQATIRAAWEAGVRYFDTAPFYGYGKAEHRLGAVLREYPRDQFVLSTKVGRRLVPCPARAWADSGTAHGARDGWAEPLPFDPVYDYTHDGILRSFEDSQQRLGMTQIDLLLIHDIGLVTHGERNAHYWTQLTRGGGFRALERLRAEGTVRAVGLGVNEGQAILAAMAAFDLDCALLAGRYTLLEQDTLNDLLPACERRHVSILLGGAFNSGILAHGTRGDAKFNYADAPPEVLARVARIEVVCAAYDVPLAAAALQFPYAHPAVVALLSGARSVAEVEENVAAFQQPIPAAFWSALREQGLLHAAAPVPGATAKVA